MTSSNVLFCSQLKDIQFAVREEETNYKLFTYEKLEWDHFEMLWLIYFLTSSQLEEYGIFFAGRIVASKVQRCLLAEFCSLVHLLIINFSCNHLSMVTDWNSSSMHGALASATPCIMVNICISTAQCIFHYI